MCDVYVVTKIIDRKLQFILGEFILGSLFSLINKPGLELNRHQNGSILAAKFLGQKLSSKKKMKITYSKDQNKYGCGKLQ